MPAPNAPGLWPLLLAVALTGAGRATPAQAGVRIVVGATAGGPVDALARQLRDALAGTSGTGSIVDNRPGAGGTLAAQQVVDAPPDGRTVLVAGMGSTVAAPYLYPSLRYHPAQDLRPVALLATSAMALVVPADGGPRDVAELVARARARGRDGVLFASTGLGTANHLCARDFARAAGFAARSVPFGGDVQAVSAMVNGDLGFMFMAPNVAWPLHRDGRLRILATSGPSRAPSLGRFPTLQEAGVSGLACQAWTMVFAPARVGDAEVDALAQAWRSALDDPARRAALEALGMDRPPLVSPVEAERFYDAERARLDRQLSRRPPVASPLPVPAAGREKPGQ